MEKDLLLGYEENVGNMIQLQHVLIILDVDREGKLGEPCHVEFDIQYQ